MLGFPLRSLTATAVLAAMTMGGAASGGGYVAPVVEVATVAPMASDMMGAPIYCLTEPECALVIGGLAALAAIIDATDRESGKSDQSGDGGDVAAVPAPAAGFLLGGGLIALGWRVLARRRRAGRGEEDEGLIELSEEERFPWPGGRCRCCVNPYIQGRRAPKSDVT